MSYYVSIGEWEGNYTFNSLGPLCRDFLCPEMGLRRLHGMNGGTASVELADFWREIDKRKAALWSEGTVGEPEFCALYDSPNGWGSTVGELVFMGQLTAACAWYPRHKLRVHA